MVGFGVLLVGFEGFQKLLDVFPTLHQANGSGVATPSIFNDEMKEREGRFGFTGVAKIELGGLEGHVDKNDYQCIIFQSLNSKE